MAVGGPAPVRAAQLGRQPADQTDRPLTALLRISRSDWRAIHTLFCVHHPRIRVVTDAVVLDDCTPSDKDLPALMSGITLLSHARVELR